MWLAGRCIGMMVSVFLKQNLPEFKIGLTTKRIHAKDIMPFSLDKVYCYGC